MASYRIAGFIAVCHANQDCPFFVLIVTFRPDMLPIMKSFLVALSEGSVLPWGWGGGTSPTTFHSPACRLDKLQYNTVY